MRVLGACVVVLACASAAPADDFHIDTALFVGDDKEQRSENVTLFHSGQVYDFTEDGGEVTLFDPARARFVLLDPARKMQVELPTAEIEGFARQLQRNAALRDTAELKFLADPQFNEAIDPATGESTYSSPWLTYRLRTESARTEQAARQYGEFSDWYARLNTMINVTPLPLARLAINARLKQRQLIPVEVTRTMVQQRGLIKHEVVVRTEHHVTWGLNANDLERVAQVGADLVQFEVVTHKEYRARRAAAN